MESICRLTIGDITSPGAMRPRTACRRGNDIGATTYGSIKSILQHGLDRAYAKAAGPCAPTSRRHGRSTPNALHAELLTPIPPDGTSARVSSPDVQKSAA